MRRWVSEAKRLISAMSFAFGISRLIIPRLEIGLEKFSLLLRTRRMSWQLPKDSKLLIPHIFYREIRRIGGTGVERMIDDLRFSLEKSKKKPGTIKNVLE